MTSGDFVYTSANDGTCLIRPITAKAETWFKRNIWHNLWKLWKRYDK